MFFRAQKVPRGHQFICCFRGLDVPESEYLSLSSLKEKRLSHCLQKVSHVPSSIPLTDI